MSVSSQHDRNQTTIQFNSNLSASDSSAMVDQLNRDPLDIELVLFGGDIRQYIYIYISNLINNKTLIVMFYFGNVVTRMAIRRRALTTCGINGDSSFNAMFVLSISLLKICNNYIFHLLCFRRRRCHGYLRLAITRYLSLF